MDSIPIILQHSGHWDDNTSYVNFQVCGLLIPTNCNYSNLVGMICNEFNLQPQLTSMKIEYQVKDGYPPFNIVDDLKLMFYLKLKKREITNPGSIIELKLNENRCFLYVFVALNSLIKWWTHCIPIIVVDGTFLKSAYGGTLLVAATQDACGKTFPLAFCVVDSENGESWEWFFIKFRKSYDIREDMTIVSDRHESIIKGAIKVYPEVPHVFCIFHLLSNIKSKFKKNSKKIKDAFFSTANAYTVKKFEYHMKELDKVDMRVKLFLEEVGYEKWAKVYSLNDRYSNMTSNVAESLNSVTMLIRELPICTMLESLRALVQKWSCSNRNTANATSTRLTTKFEEILKKNYLYSVDLTVHPTNHILFEVHNGERKNVVDLNKRSCTCNRLVCN
ncbi:hypothetical protein POM88_008209 [Heracleum sosnowskyi]|uniref:MULE transposase domain-containing protein n=1 Tax=Heracleum sosnowskyi TaxID=360622 RepID=A0AAD8J6Z3_9APIA|nr:hypothetical protein POM88_008209 [Heracleum sosnowskyi]